METIFEKQLKALQVLSFGVVLKQHSKADFL